MHRIGLRALAAFAVIAFAVPLTAQNAPCQQTAPCPVNPPKPLLSYTAEIRIHSVQTLADGTTITRDSKEFAARDSQGRFLSSNTGSPFGLGNSRGDEFTSGNANDPVDNTQTNWDSRSRKARVLKMPPIGERHGCWASDSETTRMNFGPGLPQPRPASGSSVGVGTGGGIGTGDGSMILSTGLFAPAPVRFHPATATEDLGTAVIMGLEAHGTRTTTTTSVGEVGNDKPLVHTTETWTAPGLLFPLRQISTDPRTGTETREVVSLDLSDPPLSTFQPPEGYEITADEMREVACQPPMAPGHGRP
jgi:hypothetical protein